MIDKEKIGISIAIICVIILSVFLGILLQFMFNFTKYVEQSYTDKDIIPINNIRINNNTIKNDLNMLWDYTLMTGNETAICVKIDNDTIEGIRYGELSNQSNVSVTIICNSNETVLHTHPSGDYMYSFIDIYSMGYFHNKYESIIYGYNKTIIYDDKGNKYGVNYGE